MRESAKTGDRDDRSLLRETGLEDLDSFAKTLKPVLMEAIQDVLDELETVYDNIAKNAKDHIHSEYANIVTQLFLFDTQIDI